MRRKRSQPWIHKWSRFIIGAIATVGFCLTAYLTITKLTGGAVVCSAADFTASAQGCNSVLDSPYATVFGLPLSLFGALAYLSMGSASLLPYAINADQKAKFRESVEQWTWLFLLVGATSMMVFSGYLMYVLFFKLQMTCYYCIGSALFSLSLFGLTLAGRDWDDMGQLITTAIIAALMTLVVTLGIYSHMNSPAVAEAKQTIPAIIEQPKPGVGWEISTTSGPAEQELAAYLTEQGAVMYGAYWCPHCFDQKLLFGKEAFAAVTYVECAEDATEIKPDPAKCDADGVTGYPAWKINDTLYPGVRPLEELATLTGYTGSQDFKYQMP